jgi:hypothetical protein
MFCKYGFYTLSGSLLSCGKSCHKYSRQYSYLRTYAIFYRVLDLNHDLAIAGMASINNDRSWQRAQGEVSCAMSPSCIWIRSGGLRSDSSSLGTRVDSRRGACFPIQISILSVCVPLTIFGGDDTAVAKWLAGKVGAGFSGFPFLLTSAAISWNHYR